MATEITNDVDAKRYALRIDGQLASVLDYSILGQAISLTHTYTQPPYRRRGLGADLVAFAIDDIDANTTLRIVPMCWFASDWFESHPERAYLLADRTPA